MKILLIEPDRELSRQIQSRLEQGGYIVDLVHDALFAEQALAQKHHGMVILSLDLPGVEGAILLTRFRLVDPHTPVIVVLSPEAFPPDAGEDDWVRRPLEMGELGARVRAVLRRHAQPNAGHQVDLSKRRASSTNNQFDLFRDGRDIVLRNDVIAALEKRDAVGARETLRRLTADYPKDTSAPALEILVQSLEQPFSPMLSHEALRDASDVVRTQIEPAACRIFGDAGGGRSWCLPVWQKLARCASGLPFRRDMPECHAAPVWMRAREWATAKESIEGIESWRRIPIPLAWMTETVYRLQGLDSTWPLLAELAWLSPKRFDALIPALNDSSLLALHRMFDAEFDGQGTVDDLAWFPAWVLTEKTGLAGLLRVAEPSTQTKPEQGMRLMLELLNLERAGRRPEVQDRRQALLDLHAGLFRAYMRTR